MAMMDKNENMVELLVGTWNPKNCTTGCETDTGLVVMESGKKTGPKKRVEEIVGETCMKKQEAKGKKQQKNHPVDIFYYFSPLESIAPR